MPVCTVSAPHAGTSPQAVRGLVDPSLVRTLKEKGMELPVRALCDPRLDYPELLLLHGFEFQLQAEGSRYTFQIEPQYYQAVDYWDDSRRLVTRCGSRAQILTRDGNGRVTETWE